MPQLLQASWSATMINPQLHRLFFDLFFSSPPMSLLSFNDVQHVCYNEIGTF